MEAGADNYEGPWDSVEAYPHYLGASAMGQYYESLLFPLTPVL